MKSMIPALEFTGQPPKAQARPRRRRRKVLSPENPKVRLVSLANQPMDSEEIQLVVRGAKWVSPQFEEEDLVDLRPCQATDGLREQLFPEQHAAPVCHRRKRQGRRKRGIGARGAQPCGGLTKWIYNSSSESPEGEVGCARGVPWEGPCGGGGGGARLEWSCARVRTWKRVGLTRSQDISLYPSVYGNATPRGEEDSGAQSHSSLSSEEAGHSQDNTKISPSPEVQSSNSRKSSSPQVQSSNSQHSLSPQVENSNRQQSSSSPAQPSPSVSTINSSEPLAAYVPSSISPQVLVSRTQQPWMESRGLDDNSIPSPQEDSAEIPVMCQQSLLRSAEERASGVGLEKIPETASGNAHQVSTNQSNTSSSNLRLENLSDLFSSMSVDEEISNSNPTPSPHPSPVPSPLRSGARTHTSQTAGKAGNNCNHNFSVLSKCGSISGTSTGAAPAAKTSSVSPPEASYQGLADDQYYLENLEGFENEFVGEMTGCSCEGNSEGDRRAISFVGAHSAGTANSNVDDTMQNFKPTSSSTPFRAALSKPPSINHLPLLSPECRHQFCATSSYSDSFHLGTGNREAEMMECGQTCLSGDRSTRLNENSVVVSDSNANSTTSSSSHKASATPSFGVDSSEMEDSSSTRLGSDWSNPESYLAPESPVHRQPPPATSAVKSILKKRNYIFSQYDSETCGFVTPQGNRTFSKSVTFKLPLPLTDSSSCDLRDSTGSSSILALETPEHLWRALPLTSEDREKAVRTEVAPVVDQQKVEVDQALFQPFNNSFELKNASLDMKDSMPDSNEAHGQSQGKLVHPWDSEEQSFDAQMEEFLSQKDKLSLLDAAEEGFSILAMETPLFMWASPPINFINSTFN